MRAPVIAGSARFARNSPKTSKKYVARKNTWQRSLFAAIGRGGDLGLGGTQALAPPVCGRRMWRPARPTVRIVRPEFLKNRPTIELHLPTQNKDPEVKNFFHTPPAHV